MRARAINDNGAIAATAETNGVTHGIILIPDVITRDGYPNTVVVGQQVNLANVVLGKGDRHLFDCERGG
jgi:hypothetical protein